MLSEYYLNLVKTGVKLATNFILMFISPNKMEIKN